MLTSSKKKKLLGGLKAFQKKYFSKKLGDLDESGTRLLINDLLSNVLGYESIEEIKTEYMIKGTYADYVVQIKGVRHFLVEVKALSLKLSDKHLRQTISYGANEGIEWAILTNGREVALYKIIFGKPIDSKLIFTIDISDPSRIKQAVENLQFLHRDGIIKKSLPFLWNRFSALETYTIAGLLFGNSIINFLKRELKRKYKSKFDEKEIRDAVTQVVCGAVDMERVKMSSGTKKGKVRPKSSAMIEAVPLPINASLN